MDVGGLFFDFEAVRTDLTEMLHGSVPLTPVQVRSDVPVARPVEETMSEAGSATAAALEFERRAEERVPRGTSTPSAPPLSQLV